MKFLESTATTPRRAAGGALGHRKAVADQMDDVEAPIALFRTNKPDGFDCPGCAWPDQEHTSTFQFCENGAKAVTWEATKKRVCPSSSPHIRFALLELQRLRAGE